MRLHPQVLQVGTSWALDNHTKRYFLEGDRKAIIDTGVGTSPEQDIAPYLAYFGYRIDDIDLILNTHGHYDHVDGNPGLPKAEAWIHEEDAFLLEDPEGAFDASRRLDLRFRSQSEIERERARYVAGFKKQKVDRRLKNGDVVDLGQGIQLTVLHLPGHTKGSVGYLWEKEGMLFMGDSVSGLGTRPGVFPVLYFPFSYARTLQTLAGISLGTAATAHFFQSLRCSSNPIKTGGQIGMYFQDCRETDDRMLEAVAKAIHRHWQAPLPVIIAAAVDELAAHLYLRREPSTGLPSHAVRTLGAYYDDIMGSL